jgi:hypothetical protein
LSPFLNGKLHVSAKPARRRSDDPGNLALACIDCNLHKGTNLTGIDPQTNDVTELFHPRRQSWDDHFEWRGIHLDRKNLRRQDDSPRSQHEFRRPDCAALFLIGFHRPGDARPEICRITATKPGARN